MGGRPGPGRPLRRRPAPRSNRRSQTSKAFARLASSIEHNAKGKALLKALHIAFAKAREIGAEEKAIIFTESRKTQSYLLRVLADSPFAEGVVLFNGSNTDDRSKADLQQLGSNGTRAPTASPGPEPPTCVRPSWTTSAKRAGS